MEKEIVFFDEAGTPFNGATIENTPLGGCETAILRVAEGLAAKGFTVTVYNNCLEEGMFNKVEYKNRKRFESEAKNGFGMFVSQRGLSVFQSKFSAEKKFLWLQDNPKGELYSAELKLHLRKVLPEIDSFFVVSKFQKNALVEGFPFAGKKGFFLTRNGVDEKIVSELKAKEKNPGKFVYSTTPFRGLAVLLKLWPEIKRRIAEAELHIFGGRKVYQMSEGKWQRLYDKAGGMEAVFVHGALPQKELLSELSDASLYLYPNTFEETSCISAMESISLGVPIITSRRGALPETVRKGCGVLIEGDPLKNDYQQKFVEETVGVSENRKKWKEMNQECLKQDFSWKTVVKEWVEFLEK